MRAELELADAGPAPTRKAAPGTRRAGRIRVLHSVGHLLRGGIEGWLYQMVRRLDPERFEHHVMVWTEEEQAFTAKFRRTGARVLPCRDYKNPLLFARNFKQLVRANGPYNVLHTHGTHYHGYVMLLARLLGIPARVAHSHNDIRPVLQGAGLPYRAYAATGHVALRRLATAGLGVSELAAASMFGADWRSDPRWRLLFCGIDLEPFAAAPDPHLRSALGIPRDRFVVGHVGRFAPQKNHRFILEVAAALVTRKPNAHFLLIGDGDLRDAFVAELHARGLTPCFTLVRDCQTVPAHMVGAMDGFILPSFYEGLALVTVEAQAAGLPCLFSDTLAPEAVIDPKQTVTLSLESGPHAWADAITRMPSKIDNRDAELRALFSNSNFNIERASVHLAEIYQNAVTTHHA